jgi:hypothetical protein
MNNPAIKIHANVTAYKGQIIIELLTFTSIPDETHVSMDNPSVLGQMILDSGKHLGVSKEALALIQQVKPGHDSMGEIDWFKAGEVFAFGWLGGPYKIVSPEEADASRQFVVGDFVEIPNVVPAGAKAAIDKL